MAEVATLAAVRTALAAAWLVATPAPSTAIRMVVVAPLAASAAVGTEAARAAVLAVV